MAQFKLNKFLFKGFYAGDKMSCCRQNITIKSNEYLKDELVEFSL